MTHIARRHQLILMLIIFIFAHSSIAQKSLHDSLERISKDAGGSVGISLLYKESGKQLSLHGNDHFPMHSVYKFHLALKVFHDVEEGKLTLDQKIHIDQKDWIPRTYSPVRDKYKGQTVDLSLSELLQYTVSNSDNNGCELLFKQVGGTKAVNDYIHSLGIQNIAIVATESEMAAAWNVQYTNWCTPLAMTALLQLFMDGKVLNRPHTQLLMQFLMESHTGPNRIKGLLPPSTQVAHKTGTSGTNDKGITAATNDAGIITLPDGGHLIITVFVKDSPADEATREAVIARVAAIACKY